MSENERSKHLVTCLNVHISKELEAADWDSEASVKRKTRAIGPNTARKPKFDRKMLNIIAKTPRKLIMDIAKVLNISRLYIGIIVQEILR